jgi:protein involved in polysaccharide export with SLBB domain
MVPNMNFSGYRLVCALIAALVLWLPSQGVAQVGIGAGAGDLATGEQAQAITREPAEQRVRTDWRGASGYRPAGRPIAEEAVAAFGSHLFDGGFRGLRADGLSPDYRVMPGDQITLRIWGALEIDRVIPVDSQGNIFIPAIGPISVQGVTHNQLDDKVRGAVRTVYPDNVHVYTNLQGVQPVAVFVTGFVKNPGRYAGTPKDAILYFLDQAGGIDDALGSYRDIRVVRNGEVIARADLYRFLLDGILDRPQFRDDDTIVVGRRGPTVTAGGDVERPYRYELTSDTMDGANLLQYARIKPDVSHVLVHGERITGPFAAYYPMAEVAGLELRDGDELLFSADLRRNIIVVQVEGSYFGPSRYALPKDARLQELLDGIAVPAALTDVESVSLRRVSVAEQQRQSLQESLRRLETTYLSAPSSTPEEAAIRVQEAQMISDFVQRASQVEPSGRMVVASNGRISNVRLQEGDIITIPRRSDSLLISGEVLVPQSVVYAPGRTVVEYINGAGGFTQQADKKRILVVRQNGEVRGADELTPRPGDEILVLPAAPTKNLQLAATLTQILYQIAVATAVVINL